MRVDGVFASPAFVLVLMFLGLMATPAALYLYWAHPAWSWLYLVDPARLPGFLVAPMIVLQGGALVGAWILGAVLIRGGRDRALLGTLAGMFLLLGILGVALSSRIGAYGSYEVFEAGAAVGLLEVKLGYVLIAILLGLGTAAAFVALELLRDARRARARRAMETS